MQFNDEGLPVIQEGEVINKDAVINWARTEGFREVLSKDVGTHGNSRNFKTLEDFEKGWLSAQDLFSSPKVVIPKEGDSPEVFKQFYEKMDIPEKEDGYELSYVDNITPELKQFAETKKATFLKQCKANNISKKAANELWKSQQSDAIDDLTKINAATKAQKEADIDALQKEWGDGYDANLKFINGVMGSIDKDGSFTKWADSKGLKSDPALLKFVYESSKHMKEDHLKDHDLMRSNNTPLDAEADLHAWLDEQSKNKKTSPFYDAFHPQHDAYVKIYKQKAAKARGIR